MLQLEHYQRLIDKQAWYWSKRMLYGPTTQDSVYDFEELRSEGVLQFFECIDSYNNTKGEFSTYLYHCLKNRFSRIFRKAQRQREIASLQSLEHKLAKPLFMATDSMCGFKEALFALPASAIATFFSIVTADGRLNARHERAKRIQRLHNLPPSSIKNQYSKKDLRALKKAIKGRVAV